MVSRSLALSLVTAAVAFGCASGRTPIHVPSELHEETWLHDGEHLRWTFDDVATPGTEPMPPVGPELFTVLGRWAVARDDDGPATANVFRQSRAYRAADAPRVLVTKVIFERMTARVWCRPEAGEVARGCGLIFHAQTVEDYLLAYLDARGTVMLSEVADGIEHEVARAVAPATSEWRELTVECERDAFGVVEVALDGVTLLRAGPDTRWRTDLATRAGRIGLLTKADAITAFDNLEVRAGVGIVEREPRFALVSGR